MKKEIKYIIDNSQEVHVKDMLHKDIRPLETCGEYLTDRERQVLLMRHHKQMTLEDIGHYLEVSKERVRQIEAKGLRLLRHPAMSRELKQYVASG